jgi:hypothetical protein
MQTESVWLVRHHLVLGTGRQPPSSPDDAGPARESSQSRPGCLEATALWPASRLVDVWNGFAGAPPFAELKEVKRFTDRKSAVTRIWNAAPRLVEALE